MSDCVIHPAFIHDFSKFKASCEIDRHAIETLGSALAGSHRPLIVTSGVAFLSPGHLTTEDTAPASSAAAIPRVSEQAGLALASRVGGTPSSLCHGDCDHCLGPRLIRFSRENGRFSICSRPA